MKRMLNLPTSNYEEHTDPETSDSGEIQKSESERSPIRPSTTSQPSADWKDYWVQKSIDEALKKPDDLRDSLNNLRHTTYITVAISAGLLVGVIGAIQILYPDNSPAWRPYLTTVILYILGWLSVLCTTLYIHYPIKSIGMDIQPEKVLKYTTRDQADAFIKGIQERVESSRKPLTRRAIAVKVSIVSVAVQMASIVLAAIEGIVP